MPKGIKAKRIDIKPRDEDDFYYDSSPSPVLNKNQRMKKLLSKALKKSSLSHLRLNVVNMVMLMRLNNNMTEIFDEYSLHDYYKNVGNIFGHRLDDQA